MAVRLCVLSWFLITVCAASDGADDLDFSGPVDLPEIVRYQDLPRRMYLEPALSLPEPVRYVPEKSLALFRRLLADSPDSELLVGVIRSIERVVREDLADMRDTAEGLQLHLQSSPHRLVRQSSASALAALGATEAASSVAAMCVPEHEALCLQIEPDFTKWGGAELQSAWLERVRDPGGYSSALVKLACEGLVQLNDRTAVEPLQQLLASSTSTYARRYAAARAIGALDAAQAAVLAQDFISQGVTDRLLACALLEQAESPEAQAALLQLCDDPSNAVAARAWDALLERNAESLLSRMEKAIQHPEAGVRFAVLRLVRLLPDAARCDAIHQLVGDIHIGVRNAARQTLRDLATSHAELRPGILKNAGASVADQAANWQQIEQSLVLLGELRHAEWQAECVRLLKHPRAEVFVSAAWLLHLMPAASIQSEVTAATLQRHELSTGKSGVVPPDGIYVQLVFLFQHGGLLQIESLQPLCEQQFSKSAGEPEVRAAGLWALGKIQQGKPDADLVKKLTERIFDDNPFQPEYFVVRRMCVLALVWMDARSAVPDMHRVRETYGPFDLLGEAARWALPMLGAEQPVPPDVPREILPGFSIGSV